MTTKARPTQPTRQAGPRPRPAGPPRWRRTLFTGATALAIAAAAAAAFAIAGRSPEGDTPEKALQGEPAPPFSETDVVTGEPVSSSALEGKNVLLFFSEGVMCQACFVQIQALQLRAEELTDRGLVLVNITPDEPDLLREAVAAYDITTPLVSDEDRDMSLAYDVLGTVGAMHPDTPGHTFILVDADGQIRWRRDYEVMYVEPDELLAALPRI